MKQIQSISTPWFAARASAFAALCAFGMVPLVATAQITVDPSAAARASLGTSGNGTQLVNIVAPNAAGVSSNQFLQYNVGTGGVILNNATSAAQTKIGGAVAATAALGGKNASTVLMQVTGGSASQMLGMTEVAGKGANVVIANPAGITCSGCGFLNAPRVTLSTGTPVMKADGSLGSFDVKQGTIAVQGNGLDGSTSAVDLIARAITVNGRVQGKSIDAIAGANRVDYASKSATAQAGTGDKPQLAIDVQALGSMYGDGAVRLIGTEAGVGVRDNGALTSMTNSVDVSSNGDVTIGAQAALKARGVSITGNNVTHGGTITADAVRMTGFQSLTSNGVVDTTTDATLLGDRVTLSGGSVKGDNVTINGRTVSNAATVNAGQMLDVLANRIDNAGTLASNGAARVSADDTFANVKGTLTARDNLQLNGATIDNRNGKIDATSGAVYAQAGSINNAGGSINAANMMNIDTQSIDNSNAGKLTSNGNASINVYGDVNNAGGTISAANSANVNVQNLQNAKGTVMAGNLTLQAASIDNRAGDLTTSRDAMQVQAYEVMNGGGRITSAGGLRMQTGLLDNTSGKIDAQRDAFIDVGGKLTNDKGAISSKTMVLGSAGEFTNVGGTVTAPIADIRVKSQNGGNNGGFVEPQPQPDVQPQPQPQPQEPEVFNPGSNYVRMSMDSQERFNYQSGFYGPDGFFYGLVR